MAAHSKARDRNVIGCAVEGPVLIQIWHVPSVVRSNGEHGGRLDSTQTAAATSNGTASMLALGAGGALLPQQGEGAIGSGATDELPSMALGICLEGGVVWDCKWRPGSSSRHGR